VSDREEWLARTFVELADTLVADFDLVDFLSGLAERCGELVDAAEVGLMVADHAGNLRVMASSTERARTLELFELQNEAGPCLDCFRTGERILNTTLHDADQRWPTFASLARESGYQTIHALPMRLRTEVIGAMNVFHSEDHRLTDLDAELLQAMSDVATIGILQERAVRRAADVAEQLQQALHSRVVIEQAKGIVAERLRLDMDTAFSRMRMYARGSNLRLSNLAADLVSGEQRTEVVRAIEAAGAPRLEES
jgi:transcriptional regulator with GAF, ATPase, and Fis domain